MQGTRPRPRPRAGPRPRGGLKGPRKPKASSLYVGDLGPDVTEGTLFDLFNVVGPVSSIRVCRDSITRKSLGYGYVNFISPSDAERALDTMNFTTVKGKEIRIMWSQRGKTLRDSGRGNVFVKNLHASIDNKSLFDLFSVYGNILSCKVATDPAKGESLGYGYVHFTRENDALKAIEGANGQLVSGSKLQVMKFKTRQQRMAQAPWTNVYTKYIPGGLSDEALVDLFETRAEGKVTSHVVWRKAYGVSGCLNFSEHDEAQRAVDRLHGYVVPDELLDEELAGAVPDEEEDTKRPEPEAGAAPPTDEDKKRDEEEDDEDAKGKEATEEDEKAATEAPTPGGPAGPAGTAGADGKPTPGGPSTAPLDPAARRAFREKRGLYVARALSAKQRKAMAAARLKLKNNLYIKGLPLEADEAWLRTNFSPFGTIVRCRAVRSPRTGACTGVGFVAFETEASAQRATLRMRGKHFGGRQALEIFPLQRKAERKQYLAGERLKRMQRQRRQQQAVPPTLFVFVPHCEREWHFLHWVDNLVKDAARRQGGGVPRVAPPAQQFLAAQQQRVLQRTIPIPPVQRVQGPPPRPGGRTPSVPVSERVQTGPPGIAPTGRIARRPGQQGSVPTAPQAGQPAAGPPSQPPSAPQAQPPVPVQPPQAQPPQAQAAPQPLAQPQVQAQHPQQPQQPQGQPQGQPQAPAPQQPQQQPPQGQQN